MLNIIVIYYNRDIGYILLLILIFNIINIKKKQIGGESNFFKKAATSLIPALGLVEEFTNYINNVDTNTDNNTNNNTNSNTNTESDNNTDNDNIVWGNESSDDSSSDDSSTEDSSDDSDDDDDVFGDFNYEAYKDYL